MKRKSVKIAPKDTVRTKQAPVAKSNKAAKPEQAPHPNETAVSI
jgi:hypothetical protein